MHRIDSVNAVPNLHGAGKAGFGAGDPTTGQKATYLTPAWSNALQEEVAGVIEAWLTGEVLNKLDNTQLRRAIAARIAAVAAPLATTLVPGISLRATSEDIAAKTDPNKTVSPADLASLGLDKWEARAIGERFAIQTHLVGAETPPNEEGGPRFIKLSAGDAYNTGLLSDETVSGTAPAIQATAVIALATSPLYGQTIRLVNTERRFFRAGESGALEADAIRDITGAFHVFRWGDYAASGAFSVGTGTHNVPSGANSYVTQLIFAASNVVPTADENRPRNLSETNYMRIA